MSDLIVHQFENMIINVFGMHFDFVILHVSTIMESPCSGYKLDPVSSVSSICWKLTYTSWTNKNLPSWPPPSSTNSTSSPPPSSTTSHDHLTTPAMTTTWQCHITSQTDRTMRMDSDDNGNTLFWQDEDNLACQWTCHVIQTVTMQSHCHCPHEYRWVPWLPSLSPSFTHKKQWPHHCQRCGNHKWMNEDNNM